MGLFGLGKNKNKEQATETSEKLIAEQLQKQKELGDKLFSLLVPAAKENKIFNISKEGKPYPIGPIEIRRIPKNGDAYSVFAWIKDSSSNILVFQVTINVAKKNIHVLLGPYGPETDFKLENYNDIAMNLITYVKEFAYYHTGSRTALRKKLFGV